MPKALPRSTPEAQGVRSRGLKTLIDALDRIEEVHSLMVVRRGHVVAEGWWRPYTDRRHLLFSLTKSFTSTAVGLAVAEGRLGLEDPVVKFFPGVAPARPSRHLAALTVRHLLTMTTGRLTDSMEDCIHHPSGDWVKGFFRRPWLQAPGEPFVYDTGASHVLGAIVAQVTGQDLRDYLGPRLFEPLGFETPLWEVDPQGRRTGGFGLSLKTEEIARFGQLLLQKGQWEGKTILSPEWVALATSKQVDNNRFAPSDNPNWSRGYGFQFWQSVHGFRGDGAFGQYCLVVPEHELVVAITSGVDDMGAVLDAVWTHLVPALGNNLPPDAEGVRDLELRLGRLAWAPPVSGTSDLEATVGRRYVLEANALGIKELRLSFAEKTLTLRVGNLTLEAGRGAWHEAPSNLLAPWTFAGPPRPTTPTPTVSAFGWTGPRTLTLRCRTIETPFVHTLKFTFDRNRVAIEGGANVAFGPKNLPRLVGVARKG